jgi:hypothetical protein
MWNIINNYLKSIAITFGYNILYFFSYCQIKYNIFRNKLISNVSQNEILSVELYDSFSNQIKNKKITDLKDDKYDCMIITKNNGTKPSDKMVVHQTLPNEIKWNNVKYKFLSLIVMIEDMEDTYNINLYNKLENYYVVGNVIDKNFIKYYLAKYYKLNINENYSYSWQLIDENIKVIICPMDKKIILLENNYEIK